MIMYPFFFIIYRLRGTQRGGAAWARTLAHRVPLYICIYIMRYINFFASLLSI